MPGDDGDQQVDRVGTEIDRRADDRATGRCALAAATVTATELTPASGGRVVEGAAVPG